MTRPDVLERVAIENAAVIASVDGVPKGGELRLVPPLVAQFERVDASSNDIGNALCTAGRNLAFSLAHDFFGQLDPTHDA